MLRGCVGGMGWWWGPGANVDWYRTDVRFSHWFRTLVSKKLSFFTLVSTNFLLENHPPVSRKNSLHHDFVCTFFEKLIDFAHWFQKIIVFHIGFAHRAIFFFFFTLISNIGFKIFFVFHIGFAHWYRKFSSFSRLVFHIGSWIHSLRNRSSSASRVARWF